MTEYAVYKGDQFVDLGTLKELTAKLNITEGTFRSIASRTRKGIIKSTSNRVMIIEMEEENDKRRFH